MANGILEVPVHDDGGETGEPKRRLRKAIPLSQMQQIIQQAFPGIPHTADNLLSALLRTHVLVLGYETKCTNA
jgi:hypothetical protein